MQQLFIKWHERNETGIDLIDEQHRGIVSVINTFYYLMSLGTRGNMLYSCISDTMKNYSRIHFSTEEELLEASNYADIEKHKKLHKHLLLEIERIEYDAIKTNDPKPLLDFLKKWWIEHINEEDQLYARYLRERQR
jgi:hemerythrin